MLRRLLEGLQHGVERRGRQHVHFVDHVDLVTRPGRRVLRGVEQLAHLVHAGVGRGIDLEQVDEAAGIDLRAGAALPAGLRGHALLAVQAFRQNARQRRLAHATGPGEEVGVMQALLLQRVGQRPHDVLLPNEAGEVARPPLAGEHLIGHARILSARSRKAAAAAFPDRMGGEPNPRHLQ